MESDKLTANTIAEPRDDMEFESHEDAYAFYKEYARAAGFGTAKLSSRRSRASKEFIDAKFSCIRYGNKQQSDDAINPRPSPKIGCKASLHVKRRQNGKWFLYSFVKEHNHELLPAQVHFFRSHRDADLVNNDVRMRKRKNLSSMSKMFSSYQHFDNLDNYLRTPHDRGRSLVLDDGDAQLLLEFFMHMQEQNPKFFYAIDLNEEHRLRNVFWVDAKGIEDYSKFGDVVSFDTTYFANKCKMPLVLFIGVNRHSQPTLFGSALIADDTVYTFAWLMQTWLMAMGEHAPQVILTDQNNAIKSATAVVFPHTRHCFCLWHILDRIPRELEYLGIWQDSFVAKFTKCIFGSWSEAEFEKRWCKLLDRLNLREAEWVQLLYEDRMQWAPTFMRDISFAGLSAFSRAESLNSWFDKYVNGETSLREFIEKYKVILEDRYEEEAKADFDAWHEAPELKSPSPFEKQMSFVYTHEIFRKFQIEVLGAAACHLKKESEDERATIYAVKEFEDDQNYVVEWSESKSSIYCSCRSFEYKGYLCRHAMIVLQMSGVFRIPSRYILRRWTNAALSSHPIGERLEDMQSKVRRYNDLCRRAIILGEEGSLSQESYDIALCAIVAALKQCASVNTPADNEARPNNSTAHAICNAEEENQCSTSKERVPDPKASNISKNTSRKGKLTEPDLLRAMAQDGLHHMEGPQVRMAHLHGMVPMQLHNLVPTMFHNVPSTQFQNVASMQLHDNCLP